MSIGSSKSVSTHFMPSLYISGFHDNMVSKSVRCQNPFLCPSDDRSLVSDRINLHINQTLKNCWHV